MRLFHHALVCVSAAFLLLAPADAADKKEPKYQQIVIGLDLSLSNPLVDDARYATKVAQRLGPLIRKLEPHDVVLLRTFGAYDPREQALRLDRVISSKNLPEDVARVVEGIVAGVPTLVERGTIKAQPETNILAFLENMAEVIDCKAMKTTVILVSDGIEDSEFARLVQVQARLPAPPRKLFDRCQLLQILGIGVGARNPSLTSHLRSEWEEWARAAGFKKFEGLHDW